MYYLFPSGENRQKSADDFDSRNRPQVADDLSEAYNLPLASSRHISIRAVKANFQRDKEFPAIYRADRINVGAIIGE